MAEAQEADGIFIYMGGDQVVPYDVVRVRIDKSVTIIPERAFDNRGYLIYVEFHDGIEIVEHRAFNCCYSLRSAKLLGVKVIEGGVFHFCRGLTEVEFGVELETIGEGAFYSCTSLRTIKMPSVRSIGRYAFDNCQQLTDLDLPEGLETVGQRAFHFCQRLRRIAVPLRSDMIANNVFSDCPDLTTMDLVGGIHNTIASLHLESWKNDTTEEINRINQVLPNTTSSQKTAEIQQWMRSVIS
ncbi:leucine-rich repeat domain-containing protein, partial [Skeletonema marinoi]